MHLSAKCTPVARHGEPPAPVPTPTPTLTPSPIPDARPGPAPRRHRLPGWRAWLVALPLALLAACGGGSTPAADTPTPQAGAVAGDRVS
ncbi:MAG: hypothetical protein FGM55_05795, partial [Rhodoferax sp.]|nr:hypothetical protein [Rhodoferax sp.]